MKAWLINRLKEKSTWLGIFTIAGLFGMKIEPELREAIINAILAVAAVAAVVFQEKPKLPPIELQGKSESTIETIDAGTYRMRDMQPDYSVKEPKQPVDYPPAGFNG